MDSQILSSPVWQTVGVLIVIIGTAIGIIRSIQKGYNSPRTKKVLSIVTVSLTVLLIAGTSEVIHVLSPTSQILPQSPTATPISTVASLSPTSSSIATSAPTPTTESTPSTVPARKLLYNEDWSKGSDNWTTGDGWNITDGMLENDGSTKSSGIILAPFQPTSTNYSVEAHIQFLSSTDMNGKYGFGIIIRSSGAGDGYACYIIGPDYAYALITEVNTTYGPLTLNYGSQPPLKSYQYPPVNTNWHTYSVEVCGSQINFLIDNRLYPSATNGDYPSGTVVGLIDNYSIIHVSNFKVTAL